ncbi:MAG: ABC transporter substrate-binding protein, partial [Acidiferrobacterales bacterium]|nr:ABC transporter substrate-binding protein [Acidiferrobacterales bacterium]
YTPFGHSDWQGIVSDIKKFGSEGKMTAVVSTVNGDANVPFYKELGNQGISAEDIPVVAFSVGEEELSGFDTAPLVGHLAAWNYFQSAESDVNDEFIAKWKGFIGDDSRVTNDPMEATYIGFQAWVEAVTKAGTTDVDAVRPAMYGIKVPNLTGGMAEVLPNHHFTKPVLIGEIQADGQFEIVSQTEEVPGDAWTDHLEESAKIVADWQDADIACGNYNTETEVCSGQNF